MSKSVGNVIEPSYITNDGKNPRTQKANLGYGSDAMRLWIASTDYSKDVSVGQNILKNTSEALRKLRNTMRFMLANLHQFDYARDSLDHEQLYPIDKYMLALTSTTMQEIEANYENFEFQKGSQSILNILMF
jgi:isoleucyl-tRNA synthetase